MIWESCYWKEPLLDSAKFLASMDKDIEDLPEESLAKLEREIFVGFYSIRKLAESNKLSISTLEQKFNLNYFSCLKNVNVWNSHKPHEIYDFSKIQSESRNLIFLCNQIIHSFVFSFLYFEDQGFMTVCFTSDQKKNEKLYTLSFKDIVSTFKLAGNDYPDTLVFRERDEG